jgi:hypothetical protein
MGNDVPHELEQWRPGVRIRVCDDEAASADEWVDAIKEAVGAEHSVERLQDPLEAIQELVDRKVAALDPNTRKFNAEENVRLDKIDILVVDFDLIHIDEGGNRTTGEGVARLAKAYSKCGLVVVLNQYSKVDFDLSMTGHLTSFADVNVDALTVGEPSLWRATSQADFKPSYWSPLLDILPPRRDRAAAFAAALDEPMLAQIGLRPDDLRGISDDAFSFLSETADALAALAVITGRDFLRKVLGVDEAEAVIASSPAIAGNLLISRLAKWLDRGIARPLEAVVDAAHLVLQRPYFLDATPQDLLDENYWRQLRGVEAEKLIERVAQVAFLDQASALVGKKLFAVDRLERDEELSKLADAYDFPPTADMIFAEDTSRFIPRAAAKPFRAGFGNFNDRRFVEGIDKRYGPSRHYAFGD